MQGDLFPCNNAHHFKISFLLKNLSLHDADIGTYNLSKFHHQMKVSELVPLTFTSGFPTEGKQLLCA